MPIVIPPLPAVGELEVLTLDGLGLNDDTFWMESLSCPPPAKKPQWVSGADSEGAILAGVPTHENRVIEARIRVAQQASHDAVVAHIGSVLDKLQECAQNENGLPLVWDPADSTADPITFRCLLGEITDLPIDWQDSGRFVNAWAFSIRLTCLPFGQGVETLVAATVASIFPIAETEFPGAAGDVPALGRLEVFDSAGHARRYLSWGMESRWYPTSSPPSLIVDSTAMTITGYAGTASGRAGAYGTANHIITSTLHTQPQAICGLGNLAHVGAFRPHLRYYTSATSIALRLVWKVGDGPLQSKAYVVPCAVGYNTVDLGMIGVPQVPSGTQRWTGVIEAYSTDVGGETFEPDVLLMVPAEAYGRARAAYSYRAGVLVAYDEFSAIATGTALNTLTSDSGQTWATSGVATDFAAADAPLATDETVSRTTTAEASGRFAVLGASDFAATEASVLVRSVGSWANGVGASASLGVIVRWVDSSNYLRATLTLTIKSSRCVWTLQLTKVVAGSVTTLGNSAFLAVTSGTAYRVRAVVQTTGAVAAELLSDAGALLGSVSATDTDLKTGGVLEDGKPGLYDRNGTAHALARYYDSFHVAVPPDEPIVLYPGQVVEIMHDAFLREDPTGTYTGTPPEYVGARCMIPNAGAAGRRVRMAVIARRADITTSADDDIADSTTMAVYATPQYLVIPR